MKTGRRIGPFCLKSLHNKHGNHMRSNAFISTIINPSNSTKLDQITLASDLEDSLKYGEEHPGQFSYRALRYFSNDPTPHNIRGTVGPFSSTLLEEYLNEQRPLSLETYEAYAYKFACKSMVDELKELIKEMKENNFPPTGYISNMKLYAALLRVSRSELVNYLQLKDHPSFQITPKGKMLENLFQEVDNLNIPLEMCIYERIAFVFFKCKSHESISKLIINMKIKLLEPTSLIYYYWLYLLSSDKNPIPYLNAFNSIRDSNILNEDIRKLNIVWSCSMRDVLTIISNVDNAIAHHAKPSFFISFSISELLKTKRVEDVVQLYSHYCGNDSSNVVTFTSSDLTLILDSCIHTASFEIAKRFLPLVICKAKKCPIDPVHDSLVLKLVSQTDPSKTVSLLNSLKVHRGWDGLNINNINLILDACYKSPIVNHYMLDILESNISTLYNIYEINFPSSINAQYADLFKVAQSRLHDSIKVFRKRMGIIDENIPKYSKLYELACLNLDPFIFRVLLLMSKYEIEPTKTTILIIFYYYVNVRANLREICRFYSLVKPFLNEMYYGAVNSLFSSAIRAKCWHVAASILTYIHLCGLPLKSYNLNMGKRLKDFRYTSKKYQISCDTQTIYSLIVRLQRQLEKGYIYEPGSCIEKQRDSIIRTLTLERVEKISGMFAKYNIISIAQLNDLHPAQRQILFNLTINESNLLTRLLMIPDLQEFSTNNNFDNNIAIENTNREMIETQ